jgi:hypothetical protein
VSFNVKGSSLLDTAKFGGEPVRHRKIDSLWLENLNGYVSQLKIWSCGTCRLVGFLSASPRRSTLDDERFDFKQPGNDNQRANHKSKENSRIGNCCNRADEVVTTILK